MKLPVSLVVITLNEERNIERCLRSVPWASDIVVIDSGSQDRTAELAEKLGARVIQEKWRGFGPQKAFGVSQAQYDWIINLDADEELSPELSDEIQTQFKNLDPETGYLIPRKSKYLGRWILHGGWYPDYQLRLFNRIHSNWDSAPIHEKVIAHKIDKLKKPMHHYVFRQISDHVQTNNRYSGLQADAHFQKGQKFSYFKLIFKPWTKFIECYFLKLGFLDGLPGFIIAIGAAYSVFIRWAKVWELESGLNPNQERKSQK